MENMKGASSQICLVIIWDGSLKEGFPQGEIGRLLAIMAGSSQQPGDLFTSPAILKSRPSVKIFPSFFAPLSQFLTHATYVAAGAAIRAPSHHLTIPLILFLKFGRSTGNCASVAAHLTNNAAILRFTTKRTLCFRSKRTLTTTLAIAALHHSAEHRYAAHMPTPTIGAVEPCG